MSSSYKAGSYNILVLYISLNKNAKISYICVFSCLSISWYGASFTALSFLRQTFSYKIITHATDSRYRLYFAVQTRKPVYNIKLFAQKLPSYQKDLWKNHPLLIFSSLNYCISHVPINWGVLIKNLIHLLQIQYKL